MKTRTSPQPSTTPQPAARTSPRPRATLEAKDSKGIPTPPRPSGSAKIAPTRPKPPERKRRPAAPPPRENPWSLSATAVIEACRAELDTDPEPAVAGRLHFEIGRMHELSENLADARKAYETALRLAPEMLGAIRCTRRLALSRGDYGAAIPLFDHEIELVSDRVRKAALYVAKGHVLEDRVMRLNEARACYAAAVALDPTSGPATAAMAHAAVRAEDWEAVQRAHELAANAAGDDMALRAAHLARRAAVLESRLGRPEDATELYVSGLKIDARVGAALDALKRLLHGQHRWHDLVRALEIERTLAGSPSVEAATCFAIGRLHSERLGDRAAAIESLAEANRLHGGDTLVLEELARLSEAAGDTAMLAQVLESLAETLARAPERLGLLHRLGLLNETVLDDEEAAIKWHEMAASLDPTYSPSLRALTKLYTRREAWASIVKMNLAEAEASKDPRRRAAALARAADLFESRFDRPDQAVEHYAAALVLDPGAEASFKALVRLCADLGRHEQLLQALRDRGRSRDRPRHRDHVLAQDRGALRRRAARPGSRRARVHARPRPRARTPWGGALAATCGRDRRQARRAGQGAGARGRAVRGRCASCGVAAPIG